MRYLLLVALSGCALATPENTQFTENAEYQATVDRLWEQTYGGQAPVVVFGYVDAGTSGITFSAEEASALVTLNPSLAQAYKADRSRFRKPDGSWRCIMGVNTLPVHVPLATMAHEVVHVRIYKPTIRYDPTGIVAWDFLTRNTLAQIENLRAHGPEFQVEAARVTLATGIPIQPF
jgi:hypothetical protein